jgi:hypothetical protein
MSSAQSFNHASQWHDDTNTPSLLSSSPGSLFLTSLFLQGFLQNPISLVAIISYYEGIDTEGNLCGLVAKGKSS